MASLMAILGLDNRPFFRGLSDAESQSKKSGSIIQSALGGNIKGALAGFAGGLVGGQALEIVGKLAHQVEEVGNNAMQIDVGAERLGVSIERFQDLKHAAEEGGTSIEAVYAAYRKIAKASVDAENGDLGVIASFQNLGLSVEQVKRMSPDEIFDAIARKSKGAEMGAAKIAALIDVMGRGSDELLPTLKRGGFDEISIFARTEEQVKRGAQFKKDLDLLKDASSYLRDAALTAPILGGVSPATAITTSAAGIRMIAGQKSEESGGKADLKGLERADVTKKQLEEEERAKKQAEADEKARLKRVAELKKRLSEEQRKTDLDKLDSEGKIASLEKERAGIVKGMADMSEEDSLNAALKVENIDQQLAGLRKVGKEKISLAGIERNELQQAGAYSIANDLGSKSIDVQKETAQNTAGLRTDMQHLIRLIQRNAF